MSLRLQTPLLGPGQCSGTRRRETGTARNDAPRFLVRYISLLGIHHVFTNIYPTGRRRKPISKLCVVCDTNSMMPMRLAMHKIWGDDEDDPENRVEHFSLMIRIPPRRLCTLCGQVHAVLDLQHPDRRHRPTRCPSCGKRERCSGCFALKKQKQINSKMQTAETNCSRLCQSCRYKHMDRVRIECEAAHALGIRWCTIG